KGGYLSQADLRSYRAIERLPVRGTYRGFEITGPPPPASGGMHIVQMLNILEDFDMGAMGYGSPQASHLIAEVLKIAFADRSVATADPDFVHVPLDRIISKSYAAERRGQIDPARARTWTPAVAPAESRNTTHVTVADDEGNVVSATHTINGLFGACVLIPDVGFIPNNYMHNLDPRPGRTMSIAPGKRVTSSMAPMIVLKDGKVRFALGTPGGHYIFGSVMQAIINLIDHGMSLQEAVEAPRLWSEGSSLELELGMPESLRSALKERGHSITLRPNLGGGLNGVRFLSDDRIEGAACWRADGMPVGIGGGLADTDTMDAWG
ncbi:MAG: gamma-glutamyltransferase, partial [Alphaproteobacteria bacterium HGW-Alphaproteobacteria-5]